MPELKEILEELETVDTDLAKADAGDLASHPPGCDCMVHLRFRQKAAR